MIGKLSAFTLVSQTTFPEITSTVTLRGDQYFYEYETTEIPHTISIQVDEFSMHRGPARYETQFKDGCLTFGDINGGRENVFFVVSNLPPMKGDVLLDGNSFSMDVPTIPEPSYLIFGGLVLFLIRKRV